MDIRELFLDATDDGSDEYKSGWCDAICYINDNYTITKRNGEPISITFDIKIDEKELIEKATKAVNDGRKTRTIKYRKQRVY